jgi:hypothetical protein
MLALVVLVAFALCVIAVELAVFVGAYMVRRG